MLVSLLTACQNINPETAPEEKVQAASKKTVKSNETAGELLYDPEILPMDLEGVAFLSGSWYEMGVQYATEFDYGIRRTYAQMGTQMLNNLGGDGEQLYSIIHEYMDEVKEECPDLYDFVKGMDDTIEDLDFEQIAIGTVCENAYVEGGMSMVPECETISAWGDATADGHLLTATNGDTLIDFTFHHWHPMIIMYPENGNAVVGSTAASSNTLMNDKGVCMLQSGGQRANEEDVDQGNPSYWANVYALTQCDSADDLFSMVEGTFYRPVHGNCHIVDTTGNAFVYENTPAHSAVRKSGDFGEKDYLIANNGYLTEEMDSSLTKDGSWDDCPIRYDTAEAMLKEHLGKLDIGWMNEAIGSRRYYQDGKWSEANWSLGEDMYFSSDSAGINDKTTVRMITDANDLVLYRQLGSGDVYNNALPDATSRFFKITLMETPDETTRQAGRDAAMLIWHASHDLSQIDEAVDSCRSDQLNQAKTCYQKGASYTQMARLENAKGNVTEANRLFSLGSSSYAMAQEHAQNAMIEDHTFMAIDGVTHTK